MPSSRIAPTLALSSPIEGHLIAAGVSNPAEAARAMAIQEYDGWHELLMLSPDELKTLLEVLGMKHKSATKLQRYVEDFKVSHSAELAVERPESRESVVPTAATSTDGLGVTSSSREAFVDKTDDPIPVEMSAVPSASDLPAVADTDPLEVAATDDKPSLEVPAATTNDVDNESLSGEGTLADSLEQGGIDGASSGTSDTAPLAVDQKVSKSSVAMEAEAAASAVVEADSLAPLPEIGPNSSPLSIELNTALQVEGLIEMATDAGQKRGDFAEACVLFREALVASADQSAAAWFGLGYSLYLRDGGNTEEQINCYTQAVALDPSHAMARSNLGNLLQTLRKDFDGAEALFVEAVRLNPKCADAHNHLGWLKQHTRQDYQAAEKHYRQALLLDPEYADAHANLAWLLHDAKANLGPEPEEHYHAALNFDPEHSGAAYHLGLLLQARGDAASRSDAVAQFRKSLASQPTNALALMSLGTLLETSQQKDWEGAEKCYRRAIAADPKNAANAHNCLGILLESSSPPRLGEAEKHYRSAIGLDPKHASATYNLGLLLETVKQDLTGAEECYRKTLALDPNNANAHSNLGILLKEERHDYEGAEKHFRAAIAQDPNHSAAHNNLGTLLETCRGDLTNAEACYRRAMFLDPSNADAVLNLGILIHGKAETLDENFRKQLDLSTNAEEKGAGGALGSFDTSMLEKLSSDAQLRTNCDFGLALESAALYCEAAALWDLSDGEGNRYSAEARLAASRLRGFAGPSSRPGTSEGHARPTSAATGGMRPGSSSRSSSSGGGRSGGRPTSASGRPRSASGRPSSASGRPSSSSSSRSGSRPGSSSAGPREQRDDKQPNPSHTAASSPSSAENAPFGSEASAIADASSSNFAADTSSASSPNGAAAAEEEAALASAPSDAGDSQGAVASDPQSSNNANEDTTTSGIDALFLAVDRNGDGNVTRRELMGALNNGSESAKELHDLLCETLGLPDKVTNRDARSAFELAFDCLDRDGSGTIDRTEMHNFVGDMLYIADLYRKQKAIENESSSGSPSARALGSKTNGSSRRSGSMSFASDGGRRSSSFQGSGKPLPESLTELDPKIVEVLERTDVDGDGVLSNVEIIRAMRNHSEMRDLLRVRELERARAAEAAAAADGDGNQKVAS